MTLLELAAKVEAAEGPATTADYWIEHASRGPELKPLGKPCHDCAVVWGLYSELTDELSEQPEHIVEAVSARWFCHNHPNRACAGNIERIAALRARSENPA